MIAAEQKARATYDNILRFSDDPDVNKVIKFLREREVVHFQRFGEAKRKLTSRKKAHSLRPYQPYHGNGHIPYSNSQFP